MAIKLTKNELKKQKDNLKQFQRYLPTLQLKKQQLQSVIMGIRQELERKEAERIQMIGDLDDWVAVFAENELFEEKKRLVIVDQSYSEYTDKPLMSPCEAVSRGNVIQIYSLTKTYAIPGLRIGYIVAAAKHIRLLRRYLRTWSVNALAIEAGKWLLTHNVKAVDDIVAYLREAQRLNNMLAQIEGITVFPTETNFMLCRIDVPITAARLKQRLALEHHILIRDASTFTGLDSQYFRVAAQRSDENDALVSAVRRCVRSQ